MIPLDEYENELLKSFENGEWVSKGNVDERLKVLQSYIKNQNKKAGFPIKSGMTGKFTSFTLSQSKGISFMVRQAHHERNCRLFVIPYLIRNPILN